MRRIRAFAVTRKEESVGVFPTKGEQLGILFLASMPAREPDLPEERIAYLRERFGDFQWIVPTILQPLHDPATIFADDIDQVVLERWYRGRVALLGDAAHAVSATTAMGGAMALEDAQVLAEELPTERKAPALPGRGMEASPFGA